MFVSPSKPILTLQILLGKFLRLSTRHQSRSSKHILGIGGFIFLLLAVMAEVTVAAELPSVTGLNFQTSGPLRCANIGDWYTTDGSGTAGSCTTEATTSTDRIHRFIVEITPEMLTAAGGSTTITIQDAESIAGGSIVDEVTNASDPTRFELRTADGATVLQSQTINPSAGGVSDGTNVVFNITSPGTYQVTSVTGARPIFGDATVGLNDDDNSFRIVVPDSGASPELQALIGQFQGSLQQNTGGNLSFTFYFLVGPGTSSLFLRNFDLDGGGSISYIRPDNSTVPGTASGDGIWNGSSGNLNTGGDTISGLTTTDAGIWGLRINSFTTNNQTLLEANSGAGDRLVLFDSIPVRAGSFTISPDTTLQTTTGVAVDHPFTITNNFSTTDIINLTLSNTDPNYTVQLLDATQTPLQDTDGDGNLDTGILQPDSSVNLILRVTPNVGTTVTDTTQINAVSFMDTQVDAGSNTTRTVTKTTTILPTYTISGTLFEDTDFDDIFTGEPRLPANITVDLLSSDGTSVISTVVTDGNGDYSFNGIAQGDYQVRVNVTDPDIPQNFQPGTPTTVSLTLASDTTDINFGFDRITVGSNSPVCRNPYGEVYSGGTSNDIYALQPETGFSERVTNTALSSTVNSLATDHVNRKVYYADNQAIYAWDPITNTHSRLSDSTGNQNVPTMPGGSAITTLSSGGAAFYNGSLYIGIEQRGGSNLETEIYRVDFVPGSNGQTIQSLTALGVNDNTGGANGGLDNGDWGDMIVDDSGILYGALRDVGTFRFDLSTNTYTFVSSTYLGQLAKDGEGRIWGLADNGNIQQVNTASGSLFGPSNPTSLAIADLAECVIGRSTIGDRIWQDSDGDGNQDPGELGIPNVTVGLYRDNDNNGLDTGDPLLATQVTDASGNYDFTDLIFGNYVVRVLEGTPDDQDSNNVLDGASVTSAAGDTIRVNLAAGSIVDFNDADVGYDMFTAASSPNVLLVKRITRINRQTTNGSTNLDVYVDDTNYPYDDNTLDTPAPDPIDTEYWPTPNTFLKGVIDGGETRPEDEIEYTIYFLSTGGKAAVDVQLCDRVPSFQTFVLDAFNSVTPAPSGGVGANRGIVVEYNGNVFSYTNDADGDTAQYYPPGSTLPAACANAPAQAEDNGAIVVNLGDLPEATGSGTPTTSYGAVRFRAKVK